MASTARPKRSPFLALATLVLLPLLVALVAFPLRSGLVERSQWGDVGMTELYVHHATKLQQTLGVYSVRGWNHPGPLAFYLLAPLYELGGRTFTALMWSSLFVNLLFVLATLALLGGPLRRRDPNLALAGLVALTAFLHHCGARVLNSPWNPDLQHLPLPLLILLGTLAACGERICWVPIAFVGSYLVQVHVGSGLVVVMLCVSAGLLGLWMGRDPRPDRKGSLGPCLLASLLVLGLVWAPPLREEFRSPTGNLSRLLAFFSRVKPRRALLSQPLDFLSRQLTWPCSAILPLEDRLPQGPPRRQFHRSLALAECLAAFWLMLRAWKERKRARAVLALLTLLAISAAGWSCVLTRGSIVLHLVHWMSGLALPLLALVLALLFDGLGAFRAAPAGAALAILGLTLLGGATLHSDLTRLPRSWPHIEGLASGVLAHARSHELQHIHLIYDANNYFEAAGIVLSLVKAGVEVSAFNGSSYLDARGRPRGPVMDDWPLLLPSKAPSTMPPEGRLLLGLAERDLAPDTPKRVVKAGRLAVYLVPLPPR